MKHPCKIMILAGLLAACSPHSGNRKNQNSPPNDLIDQAVTLAEKYAGGQLTHAKRMTAGNGIITYADSLGGFVIDPLKIFMGLVNDDPKEDVIVSLATFQGKVQTVTRHLVLINESGHLTLAKVVESDMEILFIKNGMITADVPTHSRNSPLFNCEECRDVMYYRFKGGELEVVSGD